MPAPVYLGDEVSAAGYALAGVRARTPEPDGEAAALAAARAEATLVLVSAAVAARIPEETMRAACLALAPLTLIVPDLTGGAPLPDIAARLRRELGLEAPG
jgi:vacuolar-type H+-ATPase subunit F/Vma7